MRVLNQVKRIKPKTLNWGIEMTEAQKLEKMIKNGENYRAVIIIADEESINYKYDSCRDIYTFNFADDSTLSANQKYCTVETL